MQLTIKRNIDTLAQVEIDERTIYSKKLMNEHKISSDFVVNSPIEFQLGDYVEFLNEVFKINRIPAYKKTGTKTFRYQIDFEGYIYDLYNKRLRSSDGLVSFSLVGTAADHLNLVLSNINQISSGWTAGVVDATEEILIEYSSDSCRTALTRIVEKFKIEFSLSGKQISLKKTVGNVTAYTFEYGRGKGLYELERKQISDQNVVTRVYGYGGSTNIPSGYRNRAKQLIFAAGYLENNTGLYGIIEGDFTDESIYPKRTGTISAVSITYTDPEAVPPVKQEFYVEDSGLDFDINDYLIEGATATIVFKTGDLSGYEFEITKYDHANKRIYFNPFSEQDGYTLPNALNEPAIGNRYTLINISMPQSYIDAAEAELQAATQSYLDQNCVPQVVYGVNIDPKFIKANAVVLDTGDMVTVKDTQLGIDTLIRTSELSFPLVNQNKIAATIADFVPYTITERVIKQTVENKKETYFVDRRSAELARRNTATMNRLKDHILDQDGYFDTEAIKPRSIETLYLAVGAVASNLRLSGATFKENYGGDVNSFLASACNVVHLEVKIDDGCTWVISAAQTFNSLISGSAYYLYAKCNKDQLIASWVLTTDALTSDPGDGFYYFAIGVLLPVDSETGIRQFVTTYGKTYINGREITTGKIQSINQQNYFDLDGNKFRTGDANSSMDWNVTTPNTLTLKGALVQSQAGSTFPIGSFRGAFNASYVYYKGDSVTYNGSTWLYINNTSASGQYPAENAYWTKQAAQGNAGADGADGQDGADGKSVEFIFQRTTGGVPSIPTSVDTDDYVPPGWTDNQQGVTSYYIHEYACKRTKVNGYWGAFSSPALWAKYSFDGSNGADGNDGSNGPFVEYRYAKNGSTTTPPSFTPTDVNPAGWSTTPPSLGYLEYCWAIKSKKTYDGTLLLENWTLVGRQTGYDGSNGSNGADGADGAPGPLAMGGKDYNSGTTYYGNSTRVDIVKYSGTYYVTRIDAPGGSFSGIIPTNTSYWNVFGATFEQVATDLLFANMAWVNNLGVMYLRTGESGQRVFINGADGSMHFYNASDVETMKLADGILTAIGAMLTGATFKTATSGSRLEIVSNDITSMLAIYGSDFLAKAYFGIVSNEASLYMPSGAIYTGSLDSEELETKGLAIGGTRYSSTSLYLTVTDCFINYTGTSNCSIYLPSNPVVGKIYYIRRQESAAVTIYGNGKTIYYGDGDSSTSYALPNRGHLYMFIYDGSVWSVGVLNRNL